MTILFHKGADSTKIPEHLNAFVYAKFAIVAAEVKATRLPPLNRLAVETLHCMWDVC